MRHRRGKHKKSTRLRPVIFADPRASFGSSHNLSGAARIGERTRLSILEHYGLGTIIRARHSLQDPATGLEVVYRGEVLADFGSDLALVGLRLGFTADSE
jgi:hypothetical protein